MDAFLQKAKRQWQASGSDEDGETYLKMRLRADGWPIRRIVENLIRTERFLAVYFSYGRHMTFEARRALFKEVTVKDILEWLDKNPAEIAAQGRKSLEVEHRRRSQRAQARGDVRVERYPDTV